MSRNKTSSWQNHATPTLRHHSQPMFKASKLPCICIAWSPKSWVSFKDFFYLLQFEKERNHFALPFFSAPRRLAFFSGFFGFRPGLKGNRIFKPTNLTVSASWGSVTASGGENHKSLIFWVWPLTGCQWSQDHYICSRGFLYKPSFTTPLLLREGPTPNLSFKQKSLWTKICLLVHDPLYTPEIQP